MQKGYNQWHLYDEKCQRDKIRKYASSKWIVKVSIESAGCQLHNYFGLLFYFSFFVLLFTLYCWLSAFIEQSFHGNLNKTSNWIRSSDVFFLSLRATQFRILFDTHVTEIVSQKKVVKHCVSISRLLFLVVSSFLSFVWIINGFGWENRFYYRYLLINKSGIVFEEEKKKKATTTM